MKTNYIYLLQEREFIKTKENIYKLGMTRKENLERFNQYPKGSILLFQMICNNCRDIEKILIKKFKDIFKHQKDIGNEYFEGNYNEMIDIIYSTIKNEIHKISMQKLKIDDKKELSDNLSVKKLKFIDYNFDDIDDLPIEDKKELSDNLSVKKLKVIDYNFDDIDNLPIEDLSIDELFATGIIKRK